jgi:hypothetical protein
MKFEKKKEKAKLFIKKIIKEIQQESSFDFEWRIEQISVQEYYDALGIYAWGEIFIDAHDYFKTCEIHHKIISAMEKTSPLFTLLRTILMNGNNGIKFNFYNCKIEILKKKKDTSNLTEIDNQNKEK